MAKRSDGIKKYDIDEQELLSILDGKSDILATSSEKRKMLPPEAEEEENEKPKTHEEETTSEEVEDITVQKASKPGSKRKQGEIYEGKFLQPRELKIRQCVYISRSVHETIADIVKRIGERGLTVGVYIDTILQLHLQEHKDEINALYCKPTDKIIK